MKISLLELCQQLRAVKIDAFDEIQDNIDCLTTSASICNDY